MKPELKLGRPVLAGDTEPLIVKGKYLYPAMDGHYVLSDSNQTRYYYKVKPDFSAPPMNGDEVEVSDDGKRWHPPRLYVGKTKDGRHFTGGDFNRDVSSWKYVRFPQPSKRDRVRELIESNLFSVDTMIDQIDYIYKEES